MMTRKKFSFAVAVLFGLILIKIKIKLQYFYTYPSSVVDVTVRFLLWIALNCTTSIVFLYFYCLHFELAVVFRSIAVHALLKDVVLLFFSLLLPFILDFYLKNLKFCAKLFYFKN